MATVKNITDTLVQEIMTKNVQTVSTNDTIAEAARIMIEDKYSTLPVVDSSNKCVGILSRADLTESFLHEDKELARYLESAESFTSMYSSYIDTCDAKLVKELMIHDVLTIAAKQTVTAACKTMLNHQVHHLPVVNEQDGVIGIVSTFDIVASMLAVDV